MNHSFNIFVAEKYGVDEAIFIQNLVVWTASNASRGEENSEFFETIKKQGG